MATQCFKVTDEYSNPVQNAKIDVLVGLDRIFSNFTNPSGQLNATVTPNTDNLIYVRFNSYTPVQYVYNGTGSEPCIEINIKTCQPLQQEPLENGRFLVWNPVAYCIRNQTMPLSICGPDRSNNNVVCDHYDLEEETDYYALPVVNNDVIRWVMDKSEVDYDGDDISNLRIGITQGGVMVQEDIGTIQEYEDQLFCTATIPCLRDCEYEFVVYRVDVIDYIGVEITPPTFDGACDGIIKAVVTLGTPPYQYSLDGVNWQSSDTFTGLCAQNYTVYARDSDCSQGMKDAFLEDIDCSLYHGYTLQQMIDLGITLGQIIQSGCILCDFLPIGDVQTVKYTNNYWQLSAGAYQIGNTLVFDGVGQADQQFTMPANSEITFSLVISENSGSIDYSVEIFDGVSFYTQYTGTGSGLISLTTPPTTHEADLTIRVKPRGTYKFKATDVKVYNTQTC